MKCYKSRRKNINRREKYNLNTIEIRNSWLHKIVQKGNLNKGNAIKKYKRT